MEHLDIRGKAGNELEDHTPTAEQLNMLWNAASLKQKIKVAAMGYCGMRVSEFLHMMPEWIHFDDHITYKYTDNKFPVIRIPGKKKKWKMPCTCSDCELRAYKQYRRDKADEENGGVHVEQNSKWYQEVTADFYKISLTRKNKKQDWSRIRKLKVTLDGERVHLQGYWRPKTSQGARVIPLILPEIQEIFKIYKEHFEELRPAKHRLNVWWEIKKLGEKVGLRFKIYNHSLRSAYVTALGTDPEMTLQDIRLLSGHKNLESIDRYAVGSERKAMKLASKVGMKSFGKIESPANFVSQKKKVEL